MSIEKVTDPQPDPLTESQKIYLTIRRAVRDELQVQQKTTWRSVAHAVWHGITVAQKEIWQKMGW